MATGFTQRFKGRIAGVADSQFQAGGSGAAMKPSGAVSVNVSASASAATASAQTLKTYSIPANSLNAAGRGIEVIAFGSKAGNAAPVDLGLTIGGVEYTMGNDTQSGVSWMMSAIYNRTGASAQVGSFGGSVGATVKAASVSTDTAIETSDIAISVTATDASAATANVTCNGLIVKFFN